MKNKIFKSIAIGLVLVTATSCASANKYDIMENAAAPQEGMDLPSEKTDESYSEPNRKMYIDQDSNQESSENYLTISENIFVNTKDNDKMTFSLKVDTASYRDIQNKIYQNAKIEKDAVRIEELVNYFDFDEHLTKTEGPFSYYAEIGKSPFDDEKNLAFVRVRTDDIKEESLGNSNYVFLIDTSGSMEGEDRIGLLKKSLNLLVDTLGKDDKISIVTYSGSSGVLLDSVSGDNKKVIQKAINNLSTSGSTAGADGIKTAYEIAQKNFIDGGNNRVILATDGDFNVGISNPHELSEFISEKAKGSNVYLSVLGYGMGNTRHDIMETLSKDGNGNYSYIDNLDTAKKVLVDDLKVNLYSIANDVKAQIAFNPDKIKSYRLIGYENRKLNNEDFEDDTVDAGELGGNADIALVFEFDMNNEVETIEFENEADELGETLTDGLFEVRLRYKEPGEETSQLLEILIDEDKIKNNNSADYKFTESVVLFGHLLRNYEQMNQKDIDYILDLAKNNIGKDERGYRSEYLYLLDHYKDNYKPQNDTIDSGEIPAAADEDNN